jgi:Mrp family chromosome partitioning ATPase
MGCTTAALALAVVASGEARVLIADGDTVTRGLSRHLIGSVPMGWDDVVRGGARAQRATYELNPWQGLAISPIRNLTESIESFLTGPRLPRALAELRQLFDLIVLDGGTVYEDGKRWAPWVDAALLIGDASQSDAAEWAAAWDLLEAQGTSVLGVVETNT